MAPHNDRARAGSWLLNLSLLVLAVALPVGLAELTLRWIYEEPWYDQLVDEQFSKEKIEHTKNRFDLRDRDYPEPKPPGHFRILLLGDSFTKGGGVPDDAVIFAELLERRLNSEASYPGVRQVDILNGGISGSLTGTWYRLLKQVEEPFDPDLVVMVFFLRDGTLTTSMGAFFEPVRDLIAQRNRDSQLYRHSYLYRLYRDFRDRQLVGSEYTRTLEESYFGDEEQTAEWQRAQRNMLRIVEAARARSASVGLVVFPILVDLDGSYPFRRICDELMRFAEENGLPAHNLLDAFLGRHAPDLWVSAYNQHANPEGHAIVAEALYPFLDGLIRDKLESAPVQGG